MTSLQTECLFSIRFRRYEIRKDLEEGVVVTYVSAVVILDDPSIDTTAED